MAVKRRCVKCRTLIDAGSYCPHCSPHGKRPASPGRRSGRWLQQRRAELLRQQDGRCAWCGRSDVKLELHHIDHDHTNDSPANHILLCKSCHAHAGRRESPPR